MSQYHFANASIGVGSYAGEAARPYVAAAILSADTIANGYVSVLQNVHSVAQLRKFSGVSITAQTCGFTPGASNELTLGSVALTTSPLQVNEQVCNKDLRATWEGMQMNGQNSAAPADFTTYVAQYVAAKTAESIEINLWGGNFDPNDSSLTGGGELGVAFDGLWHHIVDAQASLGYDAEVAGAFTADADGTTGVLTHLSDVVNGAPSVIQSDPNAVIYVSRKTLFLLQRAMAGTAIENVYGTPSNTSSAAAYSPTFIGEARPATYMGFPIIAAAGCPNDTVLFCNPNQLYFGTDLLTDHINASILNLRDVTGDDVTRVIMQFSGGTQIVDAGSLAVARRTS
jgi:hypothetical protein